MNQDFFTLACEDEQYDLIFHVNSSRIAKINKDFKIEDLSREEQEKIASKLPSKEYVVERREHGLGKISLTFMSSRTCNLGCSYCFAGEGEYGRVKSKPVFFSCEKYIKSLEVALENYPEGIKSICFFGGEPLLNLKEIKKFIPKCYEYFQSRNLEVPPMSICTNLVGISEDTIRFLKEYNVCVVTSLDGPQEVNDMARITKVGGISVFDEVLKGLDLLKKNNMGYIIQATLNKHHMDIYEPGYGVEWAKEMDKLEWENLAIIPVSSEIKELQITSQEDLDKLDSFTREITHYYINKLFNNVTTMIPSGIIAPLIQLSKNRQLADCSAGKSMFVDTDSNIYPCQMFPNINEYKIGSCDEGIDPERVNSIANVTRMNASDCENCIARKICSVFCKGIQLQYNNDMYKVSKARCVYQKANIEECIKILANMDKSSDRFRLFWNNYKEVCARTGEFGYTKQTV